MKILRAGGLLVLLTAGCFTEREASRAPGGTTTVIPFVVDKWKAPVLLANHLYRDPKTGTVFDIQIVSIDGKTFSGDGRRTKFYYQIDPGPHLIVVSCVLAKTTWTATFDVVLEPGDSVEITGEVSEDAVLLWFANLNTGVPVTEKIRAVAETKK